MEQSSDDAGQPSSSHAHGPASEHSKSQLRAALAGFSRKAVMAAWNMKGRKIAFSKPRMCEARASAFDLLLQIAPRSRT